MSLKSKLILFIFFILFSLNSFSQISKLPTKEETLTYIRDKIAYYGIPYVKKIDKKLTVQHRADDIVDYFENKRHTFSNYRLTETSLGSLWLRESYRYHIKSEIDNVDTTIVSLVAAPFNQLKDVLVLKSRLYRSNGYPIQLENGGSADEWVTYEVSYLELQFDSNCVSFKNDSGAEYNNYFIIAFVEGEENLLEKVKKALLNLKRFYPKPTGDLFEK